MLALTPEMAPNLCHLNKIYLPMYTKTTKRQALGPSLYLYTQRKKANNLKVGL